MWFITLPLLLNSFKFESELMLDALSTSCDPDIGDGCDGDINVDHGLDFTWLCKRHCETYPVYSDDGLWTIVEEMNSTCESFIMDQGCFYNDGYNTSGQYTHRLCVRVCACARVCVTTCSSLLTSNRMFLCSTIKKQRNSFKCNNQQLQFTRTIQWYVGFNNLARNVGFPWSIRSRSMSTPDKWLTRNLSVFVVCITVIDVFIWCCGVWKMFNFILFELRNCVLTSVILILIGECRGVRIERWKFALKLVVPYKPKFGN